MRRLFRMLSPHQYALWNGMARAIMTLVSGIIRPDLEPLSNEACRKRTAPGVEKPVPS